MAKLQETIKQYKYIKENADKIVEENARLMKEIKELTDKFKSMKASEFKNTEANNKVMKAMQESIVKLTNQLLKLNNSPSIQGKTQPLGASTLSKKIPNEKTSKINPKTGETEYYGMWKSSARQNIPKWNDKGNRMFGINEPKTSSGQVFGNSATNTQNLQKMLKFHKKQGESNTAIEKTISALSGDITIEEKDKLSKVLKKQTQDIIENLNKMGKWDIYINSIKNSFQESSEMTDDIATTLAQSVNTLESFAQALPERLKIQLDHLMGNSVPSQVKGGLTNEGLLDYGSDYSKQQKAIKKAQIKSSGVEQRTGNDLLGGIFSEAVSKQQMKAIDSKNLKGLDYEEKKRVKEEVLKGNKEEIAVLQSSKETKKEINLTNKEIYKNEQRELRLKKKKNTEQVISRSHAEKVDIISRRTRYKSDTAYQRQFGSGEQKLDLEGIMGRINEQGSLVSDFGKTNAKSQKAIDVTKNLKIQAEKYKEIKDDLKEINSLKTKHKKLEIELTSLVGKNASNEDIKSKQKELKDSSSMIDSMQNKTVKDTKKLYDGILKTDKDILIIQKQVTKYNQDQFKQLKEQKDLSFLIEKLQEKGLNNTQEEVNLLKKMSNIHGDAVFDKEDLSIAKKFTQEIKNQLDLTKKDYENKAESLGMDKEELDYTKKVEKSLREIAKLETILQNKESSKTDKIKASKKWIESINNLEEENLKIKLKENKLDEKHISNLKKNVNLTKTLKNTFLNMSGKIASSMNSWMTNILHIKGALIGIVYYIKSELTKYFQQTFGVVKNIVDLTDELTISRSSIASIFSPGDKPNFGFADKVMKISEKIAINAKDAKGIYDGLPILFKDVVTTMKAMASIPNIKATFFDMDKNSNQKFDLEKKIKSLASASIRLTTIDPTQTTEGALFSLREALSGDFISLKKRFEIQPEFIAQSIGKSVEYLKKHPMEFLRGLEVFFKENFGDTMRAKMNDTVQGIIIQVESALQTLGYRIGKGDKGIVKQLINNFFLPMKEALTNFLSSDFGDIFVDEIQNRFGEMLESVKSILIQTGDIIGQALGGDLYDNIQNPVSRIARIFLDLMNIVKNVLMYINRMMKTKRSDLVKTVQSTVKTIKSLLRISTNFGNYFVNSIFPKFLSLFEMATSSDMRTFFTTLALIMGPGNMLTAIGSGLTGIGSLTMQTQLLNEIKILNGTNVATQGILSGFINKNVSFFPMVLGFLGDLVAILSGPIGIAGASIGLIGNIIGDAIVQNQKEKIKYEQDTGGNIFAKLASHKGNIPFKKFFGQLNEDVNSHPSWITKSFGMKSQSDEMLSALNKEFNKQAIGYNTLTKNDGLYDASYQGMNFLRTKNGEIIDLLKNKIFKINSSKELNKIDYNKLLESSGLKKMIDIMFKKIPTSKPYQKLIISDIKSEIKNLQIKQIKEIVNSRKDIVYKREEQAKIDNTLSGKKQAFNMNSTKFNSLLEQLSNTNDMFNLNNSKLNTSNISKKMIQNKNLFMDMMGEQLIKEMKKAIEEGKPTNTTKIKFAKNLYGALLGEKGLSQLAETNDLKSLDITNKKNVMDNLKKLENLKKTHDNIFNYDKEGKFQSLKSNPIIDKFQKMNDIDIKKLSRIQLENIHNNLINNIKELKKALINVNNTESDSEGKKIVDIVSNLYQLDKDMLKNHFLANGKWDKDKISNLLNSDFGNINIQEMTLSQLKEMYKTINQMIKDKSSLDLSNLQSKLKSSFNQKAIENVKQFVDFNNKFHSASINSIHTLINKTEKDIQGYKLDKTNDDLVKSLKYQLNRVNNLLTTTIKEQINKIVKQLEKGINDYNTASLLNSYKGKQGNINKLLNSLSPNKFHSNDTKSIIDKRRSQIELFRNQFSEGNIRSGIREKGKEGYLQSIQSSFSSFNTEDINKTLTLLKSKENEKGVKETIKDLKSLKKEMDDVRNSTKDMITSITGEEYQFDGFNKFGDAFKIQLDKMSEDFLSFDEMLRDASGNTAQIMNDGFKNGFFELFKGKTEEAKDVFDNMLKSIRDEFFQTTAEMAKRALMSGLSRWFGGLFGGSDSGTSSTFSDSGNKKWSIPGLADGGVIDSPMLALLGERTSSNPEFVVNSPQMSRIIKSSLEQASMNQYNNTTSGGKNITQHFNFTNNISGSNDEIQEQIQQQQIQIPMIVKNTMMETLNQDSDIQNSVKYIARS